MPKQGKDMAVESSWQSFQQPVGMREFQHEVVKSFSVEPGSQNVTKAKQNTWYQKKDPGLGKKLIYRTEEQNDNTGLILGVKWY